MRSRPILFSAPMVLALLAGRKTMTRRIVKIMPEIDLAQHGDPNRWLPWCPYGEPGDRLWVKETIRRGPPVGDFPVPGEPLELRDTAFYVADGAPTALDSWPWQRNVLPSIHMPRGLSRIELEVTEVRVQRLREITRADCIAEGLPATVGYDVPGGPEHWFKTLWQTINSAESWAASPWVWAISFRRVEQEVRRV